MWTTRRRRLDGRRLDGRRFDGRRFDGRTRSLTAGIAVGLSVLLLTTACGDSTPDDPNTLTVIISTPKSMVYMGAQEGEKLGVWDESGVEVEVIEGSNTSAQQALASGDADIALQQGYTAISNGVQGGSTTILGATQLGQGQYILVGADAPYHKPEDFKTDKPTFGVTSLTSQGYLHTTTVLAALGMSEDDYEIVTLGGIQEMLAALESGIIDGLFWSAGQSFTAEEQGIGRVIGNSIDYLPPDVATVINVQNEAIERRPAQVKAFMTGYYKAVRMLQDDPSLAQGFLEDYKYSRGVAEKTVRAELSSFETTGKIPEENLQGAINDAKRLVKSFPKDFTVQSAPYTYWADALG